MERREIFDDSIVNMNLLDKVKNMANGARILWDWLGEGAEVVDNNLAQNRADICIECVHNQEGGIVTKAVAWAIHEQVSLKNDLKMTLKSESRLHQCQICLCQTNLKVWVPLNKLRAEEAASLEKYPAWCWLKTEHEPQP